MTHFPDNAIVAVRSPALAFMEPVAFRSAKDTSIGQCELCGYLKLESERTHHLEHSGEFRVSLGRKRLVKTLPPKARRLCDLCHALGAGHISQSRSHQAWIAVFEHGFQIMSDILIGLQMGRRVPGFSLDLRSSIGSAHVLFS